jgi:hypothetical protein
MTTAYVTFLLDSVNAPNQMLHLIYGSALHMLHYTRKREAQSVQTTEEIDFESTQTQFTLSSGGRTRYTSTSHSTQTLWSDDILRTWIAMA